MKISNIHLVLVCCLLFFSCGHRPQGKQELQPKKVATPEMLDSLDLIARTSPDAKLRYEARMTAIELLNLDENQESLDSNQLRCLEIFATWYVQQQIDSTTNEPFIIMSYSTAWDSQGRATHSGLTFSQALRNAPVLAITLPANAYVTKDTSPLIYFEKNITEDQTYESSLYSIDEKNLLLFGDNEEGNLIMLSNNFLEDMLNYGAMRILYMNTNVKNYEKLSDADLDECLTQIVVELGSFHQQYREAYKWLKTYTN